jgi:hypothetical protein
MSCSVCTCTHHWAYHSTWYPSPCEVKGCKCWKFELLDQTAWASRREAQLRAILAERDHG